MRSPSRALGRMLGIVLGVALCASADAQTTVTTLRVWKVGSPYTGVIPSTAVADGLTRTARARGLRLRVESFPAEGFAARFAAALKRGAAPDLIAFNNMAVMNGIPRERGRFIGIGEDPAVRARFIEATRSFDDLFVPWAFLVAGSANHDAARALALRDPECAGGLVARLPGELADLVPAVTAAYVKRDIATVYEYSDPERLPVAALPALSATAGAILACRITGNDRLAVVDVLSSYERATALGHQRVLLIFRRRATEWQLLTVTRDPVSTRDFLRGFGSMPPLRPRDSRQPMSVAPATILAPADGQMARAGRGQRFGDFVWRASASPNVVMEVAEFTYGDDARLFLRPVRPGATMTVSAGQLWTTKDKWTWRVWSISATGEIAFSEPRTFTH